MKKFPAVYFAIVYWRSCGIVRRYGMYEGLGGHFTQAGPGGLPLSKWVAEDARLSLECLLNEKDQYLSNEEITKKYLGCYLGEGTFLGITLSGELHRYTTLDGFRTPLSVRENVGESVQIGRIAGMSVNSEGLRNVQYGIEPWMEGGKRDTLLALEKIGLEHPRVVLEPGVPERIHWSRFRNRDYSRFECLYSQHTYGGFTRPKYAHHLWGY